MRITAELGDALLLVLVVGSGDVDAGIAGEDQLGPAGGEVATPTRRPGLEQHRTALWTPRHGERAPNREPIALVPQLVDLVRVGEHTGGAVEDQRVVFPRVPQTGGRLEELVGAVVTGVVVEDGVDAEVLGLAVVDRRDHVPSRSTVREVVEGGEGSGHVEGRVVRRRVGRAQPDVLGCAGHEPQHDAEVELHGTGADPHGLGHRPGVDPGHGEPVVEEHQVEATVLERSAELLVVAGVEEAVLGRGMAPRARVHRGVAGLHEAD